MVNKKIFWLDGKYNAKGGYYFRDFDLIKFIEKCEDKVGEVVGIAISPDDDDKDKYSKNIELIIMGEK